MSGPRDGRRSGFTRPEPAMALPTFRELLPCGCPPSAPPLLAAGAAPCAEAVRLQVAARFGGVIPGMLVCSRPVAKMPVMASSNGGLVVLVVQARNLTVSCAAAAAGLGPEPGPQLRRTPDEEAWGSALALRGGSGFSGPGFPAGWAGRHTSFHSPPRETLGGRATRAEASISDHHIGLHERVRGEWGWHRARPLSTVGGAEPGVFKDVALLVLLEPPVLDLLVLVRTLRVARAPAPELLVAFGPPHARRVLTSTAVGATAEIRDPTPQVRLAAALGKLRSEATLKGGFHLAALAR